MDNNSIAEGNADVSERKANARIKPFNKKRYRKIFEKIIKNDTELTEQISSGDYFKTNELLLRQRAPKDNDNILHLLAEEFQDLDDEEDTDGDGELEGDYEDVGGGGTEKIGIKKPADSQSLMKAFVCGLLDNFGDMMLETGHRQRTPLFVAIERNVENLVTWMLEYPDIAKVIEKTDSSRENCVHAILTSSLPRDLMIRLIEKSTNEALKAQDEKGLTPFHLAVEYKRCQQGQLKVIEALLKQGSDALDLYTKYPTRMSVYQYHEHTRQDDEANSRKRQSSDVLNHQNGLKRTDTQIMGPHNDPLRGPKGESLRGMKEERSPLDAKQQRILKGQQSVELSEGYQVKSLRENNDIQELESCAETIRETIQLHYLRTRKPEKNPAKIASWLYDEKVGVVETYFDFIDKVNENDTVDWKEFVQSYDVLKFNSILKFVHFRKLKLKNHPEEGDDLAQDDIDGHADVKYFFDWLVRKKKVERILHVTVDEDPQRLHRDAAIESALKNLKVEILDWQKPDLSPETICNVGDHLKELHLLWGGNNAVLRAWSEPEGLGTLPCLKKIHLKYCDPRLEKSSHVVSKISEFCERIAKLRENKGLPSIEVTLPKKQNKNEGLANKASALSETAPSDGKEQHRKTNKWLDCVDDFAAMLRSFNIENLITEYSKTHPSIKDLQRDVVVAVIDDGVDIRHHSLRGRILGGETFDTSDRSHYRFSAKEHGTLMASQVVRVCPNAKIYIIKVETYVNDDNLAIDAESAASAIQAAVRQHVDVILMSWTIPKRSEYKALGNALNAALRDGILLFCSAQDEGGYLKTSDTYPAAHSPKNVFKIGAATASGQSYEWTSLDDVDYILPGHEVYERKSKYGPAPKSGTHSGSSIANALAAGLASLILYSARLLAVHTIIDSRAKRIVSVEEFKSFKSYERMKKAFGKFPSSHETKNKFMEIWDTLGTDFVTNQQWQGMNDKDRLFGIANIVSGLLPT